MPGSLAAPQTATQFDGFDVDGVAVQFTAQGPQVIVQFHLTLAGQSVLGEKTTAPLTEAQWAALTGATLRLKALAAVAASLGVSGSATLT